MATKQQTTDIAAIVAAVMAQMDESQTEDKPAPKRQSRSTRSTRSTESSSRTSGPKTLTAKHQIRGGQLKALQARLRAAELDYDSEVKVSVTIDGKTVSNWLALSKLIASL